LQPTGAHRPRRGERAAAHAVLDTNAHWQEAERYLLRALASARAMRAKSPELRAATSLARAWQTRGRAAEGRALLGSVCAWFDAGADGTDLVEARALLATLG